MFSSLDFRISSAFRLRIFLLIIFLKVLSARGRRTSGIPRSRGSSREGSPSRLSNPLRYYRSSAERTLPKKPTTPHLTENILKQSREAENALADALVSYFGCDQMHVTN